LRQTTRWSTLLCRYQTAPESPSASNSFALCLLPHGVTLKSPIHVSLKPPRRCVQLDRSSIHRHGHRRHLHSPVHQFPITDYTFSKTSHAVYEGINKITTGSNHDSFNGGVARVNHTRLRLLRWWSKNSKRLADSTSRIGLPQLRQRRDKACPQPSPHGPPSISYHSRSSSPPTLEEIRARTRINWPNATLPQAVNNAPTAPPTSITPIKLRAWNAGTPLHGPQ